WKPIACPASRPSIADRPTVRLVSQAPNAARLMPRPATRTGDAGRTSAAAPQPIWATAVIENSLANVASSACAPAAAAWIRPAAIDAAVAMATAGWDVEGMRGPSLV